MAKKGSKSKHPQNLAYKAEHRREKNKIEALRRHIVKYPHDEQAQKSLTLLEKGKSGIKGTRKYVWKKKDDRNYGKGNMAFAFRAVLKQQEGSHKS